MESLLKLSGLLSEEDGGKTDLGTLEKRLADKSQRDGAPSSQASNGSASVAQQSTTASHQTTPQQDTTSSPQNSITSPEPPKRSEEEVEALSDMMCSLVTNNCGETRYIGRLRSWVCCVRASFLIACRVIVWLFDFLAERNTVGK